MTGLQGSVGPSSVLLYAASGKDSCHHLSFLFRLHVVSWGPLKGHSVIGRWGLITQRPGNGGWLSAPHWITGGNTSLWPSGWPLCVGISSNFLIAWWPGSKTAKQNAFFNGLALKSHSVKLLPHSSQSPHKGKGRRPLQPGNQCQKAVCRGQLRTMSSTVPRV